MQLLQITFDYTVNINTPIMVAAFTAMGAALKNHWKKTHRQHILLRIQLESIVYAQIVTLEESGESWRHAYNEKRVELMKQYNFIEEES